MTKLIKPQFLYTKYDGSTLLKLYGTNEFYNIDVAEIETLEPFIDVAAKPYAIPVQFRFGDPADFNPWLACGLLAMDKETGIEYYILGFANDKSTGYEELFDVFNITENEIQHHPLEFFARLDAFEWFNYNENYKLEDL